VRKSHDGREADTERVRIIVGCKVMGSFCIIGHSGRHIPPEEWIACQIRLKEYEDGKKETQIQETQTVNPHQTLGPTLFGCDP
jgi:hypothetical protein